MSFQDAYERILQSTGLRTQTDVAAMLGVKQSSISDAKRRNHIPDSWILTLFNKKSLNPSWIRTGEGPQYVAGTDTPPTPVLSEQQAAESLEPILRAALLGVVPELARAQGFPDWYVLERTADGAPITKTAQVRGIGNSVCPPIAAALASANYSPQEYPVPEFDMPLLAICEN